MVLEGLGKNLDNIIRKIRGLPEIDKESIMGVIQELQRALLTADVNVAITFQATEAIKKRAMDDKIPKGISRKEYIIKILHDELVKILGGDPEKAKKTRIKSGKENIILLVGIQGSGKTTTIGKISKIYKNKGFKVALVCTDTWRPGAYDQLKQLADRVGVRVFGDPNDKDAISLAKKGIKFFTSMKDAQKPDIIIIDTAGRHKEETDLMEEMKKIEHIVKPDEVILVIDGTLGQQAFKQAQAFAEATEVGAIIVTKLDGSSKGGGALSAVAATGAPIRFIGVGEKEYDLEEFNATRFIGTLMGIPDMEGLLEKIEEANLEAGENQVRRIMSGKFTLDDLYFQLQQFKKLGPFKKILGMLGGQNIPEEMKDMAEGQLDFWKIALSSMTKEEKENPDLIRKTRIDRIARGSGSSYTQIKQLLKQYDQMKNMMKNMLNPKGRGKPGRGGMPNLPAGMTGMPDMGGMPGGMGEFMKMAREAKKELRQTKKPKKG